MSPAIPASQTLWTNTARLAPSLLRAWRMSLARQPALHIISVRRERIFEGPRNRLDGSHATIVPDLSVCSATSYAKSNASLCCGAVAGAEAFLALSGARTRRDRVRRRRAALLVSVPQRSWGQSRRRKERTPLLAHLLGLPPVQHLEASSSIQTGFAQLRRRRKGASRDKRGQSNSNITCPPPPPQASSGGVVLAVRSLLGRLMQDRHPSRELGDLSRRVGRPSLLACQPASSAHPHEMPMQPRPREADRPDLRMCEWARHGRWRRILLMGAGWASRSTG